MTPEQSEDRLRLFFFVLGVFVQFQVLVFARNLSPDALFFVGLAGLLPAVFAGIWEALIHAGFQSKRAFSLSIYTLAVIALFAVTLCTSTTTVTKG